LYSAIIVEFLGIKYNTMLTNSIQFNSLQLVLVFCMISCEQATWKRNPPIIVLRLLYQINVQYSLYTN